jgi:TatD DNase family protein
MNIIDTHCHLDMVMEKLEISNIKDLLQIQNELSPHKIDKLLHISCHPDSHKTAEDFLNQNEQIVGAFGLHPHEAKFWNQETRNDILKHQTHEKSIAVGECGLDYHYLQSSKEEQIPCFIDHIQIAKELNKPLIIHTREADKDTLDILRSHLNPVQKVHVHCFTGSKDFAQELIKISSNIWFGFTGVITFKNAESIREACASIPINRLLLETDAPFMAPTPFRGKPCHSGMLTQVAKMIAEVHETTEEIIIQKIRENTHEIYDL